MRPGRDSREKGRRVLAWISFGLAAIGGSALGASFVGGVIAGTVKIFPVWVATVCFVGFAGAMCVDLFLDGEPNLVALYAAMTLPSLARAVPGKLGVSATHVAQTLLMQVNKALGEWLGTSSAIGIAVVCCVVSLLTARRVIAKEGGR
jgi:hypothetical protein